MNSLDNHWKKHILSILYSAAFVFTDNTRLRLHRLLQSTHVFCNCYKSNPYLHLRRLLQIVHVFEPTIYIKYDLFTPIKMQCYKLCTYLDVSMTDFNLPYNRTTLVLQSQPSTMRGLKFNR